MSEPAKLVEFVFFRNFATLTGGVSEWLKEPASKTGVRATVSGVRIPSPPQKGMASQRQLRCFLLDGPSKACFRKVRSAKKHRRPVGPGCHSMLCRAPRRAFRDAAKRNPDGECQNVIIQTAAIDKKYLFHYFNSDKSIIVVAGILGKRYFSGKGNLYVYLSQWQSFSPSFSKYFSIIGISLGLSSNSALSSSTVTWRRSATRLMAQL